MKVIICGAGQVGWQIARHLSGERNDVTVVDNDPELINRATNTLDVQGISGFASYPDILDRAGASDADIEKLARCYWFSVEFGLCKNKSTPSELKAYGAGLLSSFGELEYACSGPVVEVGPTILEWDPEVASKQDFPITTYQPVYFLAESLQDAKMKMRILNIAIQERHWYLTIIRFTVILSIHFKYHTGLLYFS